MSQQSDLLKVVLSHFVDSEFNDYVIKLAFKKHNLERYSETDPYEHFVEEKMFIRIIARLLLPEDFRKALREGVATTHRCLYRSILSDVC